MNVPRRTAPKVLSRAGTGGSSARGLRASVVLELPVFGGDLIISMVAGVRLRSKEGRCRKYILHLMMQALTYHNHLTPPTAMTDLEYGIQYRILLPPALEVE